MAGTYQWVNWALQRPCLFKTGPQWFSPKNTASQLLDLKLINSGESEGKLFDGIYVLCFKRKVDANGVEFEIPELGHRVSASLIKDGLGKQAQHVCGQCEANVAKQEMDEIAGCHGTLQIYPEWKELEDVLQRTISEKGLASRIRATLLETTPQWYGLWASSPLSKSQCEIIHLLLTEIRDLDDSVENGILDFLSALRVAIAEDIALHVSLAPPGHDDLGMRTTFSHCPRCKAGAIRDSRQDISIYDPLPCSVCGFVYVPSEQMSSEQSWFSYETLDLEYKLGRENYLKFVRGYLKHVGFTAEKVDELIPQE
jgi:hypothetical protein